MEDYEEFSNISRDPNLKLLIDNIKDTSDLYYLSLMVISSRLGDKSLLPELIFLLNEDSLNKLIYYFGGETIRVPTVSELRDYLYGILIYYYFDIEGLNWYSAINKMGLEYSGQLSRKLSKLRKQVINELQDIKIPEIKSDNNM